MPGHVEVGPYALRGFRMDRECRSPTLCRVGNPVEGGAGDAAFARFSRRGVNTRGEYKANMIDSGEGEFHV
jgi:hypothetical protein